MIQIDPKLINTDNKQRYMEYYYTIYETLKESYSYLYYLEGVEQLFGNYKKTGKNFELFITDVLELLKQKICLNIWKLLLDKGDDALTINNFHKFIWDEFKIAIIAKSVKPPTDLENRIINMRKNFIGHNLHTDDTYFLGMNELKPFLDKIYIYFQKHWIKNFVNDNMFIPDDHFASIRPAYINAVYESLKGIHP